MGVKGVSELPRLEKLLGAPPACCAPVGVFRDMPAIPPTPIPNGLAGPTRGPLPLGLFNSAPPGIVIALGRWCDCDCDGGDALKEVIDGLASPPSRSPISCVEEEAEAN